LLIPVQSTVELFAGDQYTAANVEAAVTAVNGELLEHFQREATVIGVPAAGIANATQVRTIVNDDGEEVVVATVVLGLMNIDFEEADSLAGRFSSARFPHATLAILGAAELDRLNGLGAFGEVTAAARRNAAARINAVIEEEDAPH
jgi:hypothetical protein